MPKKIITLIVIALSLVGVVVLIINQMIQPPVGVTQGEMAPPFQLEGINEDVVSLNDYDGEFIALNLWASWCEYCIDEMPLLDELNESRDDLHVVAVNITTSERTVEHALQFLDDYPVSMQVALDREGDFTDVYLTRGLPQTYLINEAGIIVDIIVGEITTSTVEARILPYLS